MALLDGETNGRGDERSTMARLIPKENVDLYGGDIVYLETKYGSDLVTIVSLSYRPGEYKPGEIVEDVVHSVEWSGFGNYEGDYDMDDYGVTWRLWDVYVEKPSVWTMEAEPWTTRS